MTEPTQLDRIEAALNRIEPKLDALLEALADEEQEEPMRDLDGNEIEQDSDADSL